MDRFILEVPNFLPLELCNDIINTFQSVENTLESGTLLYRPNDKVIKIKKNNKECLMHTHPLFKDLDDKMSTYIRQAFDIYIKHLKIEFDQNEKEYAHPFIEITALNNISDAGYFIQRLDKDAFYEWHVDSDPGSERCNNGKNFLQMIVYLNTLEPHEGGTTEFANGQKVRPEAGKIVLFPLSWTFPHRGNVIKAKHKFIITIFISVED